MGWIIAFVLLTWYALTPYGAHGQSPVGAGVPSLDAISLRKIEPQVLKHTLSAPGAAQSVLVHMTEQPALPTAGALAEMSRLQRRQTVVETLRNATRDAQQDVLRFLTGQPGAQVQSVRPYWVFNGLALSASNEVIWRLAERNDVRSIRPDRVRYLSDEASGEYMRPHCVVDVNAVEWNIQKIRADQVWHALNVDGSGVVVANMDTGVDWRHPALFDKYRGNLGKNLYDHRANWFCATDEGYVEPSDGHGHGTHTMGTMVGSSADRMAFGVAPGAKWIAVKIFHDQGIAYDSWIHAGFEWLLDPGDFGNPTLAPDVVNNSWGSSWGFDETFRPDVQAWRAAGIIPIFSAGNDGPQEKTIGSPGSFPESIAVGATNAYDYIAFFSSRGPSLWGIKPDVAAPGVEVVSSLPGGHYGSYSGTSMAAPHLAGLSALILQANPSVSVEQLREILTSTAVRRGLPIPNNEYGWGRIDAYQAVATAGSPGYLQGTVRRSGSDRPIADAQVLARAFLPSEGFAQAVTNSSGRFAFPVAPWTYDVTVSAFGYYPTTVSNVSIVEGTTSTRDFSLKPLPTGKLHGRVVEVAGGVPISATVIVSGTPVTAVTSPDTGGYSVDLPAGTYSVQVRGRGHQVGWAHGVTVVAGQSVEQDFVLSRMPTILLVDSGAWYMDSQAIYFQQALDDLNYWYDRRTIYQIYGSERSVPTAEELARYDIVIWSCPQDSPGYVGAWEALAEYLDQGGSLFLTGQDVAYWDNPNGPFRSPQYSRYVRAKLTQDDSGSRTLLGTDGELLQGLTFSLNGGDGADNQESPDAIAPLSEVGADQLANYENGQSGAQAVENCVPYRLVYFAFGFEAINQREVRREVMRRVINAFTSSLPPSASRLTPSSQSGIQAAGQTITYTLQLHNLNPSGLPDDYHLSLAGYTWPSTVAPETVAITACGFATITVLVTVPVEAEWPASDGVTVSAGSTLSPTVWATAVITTSSPAPVLLVDDDRWYDMESFYQAALTQNGLPYDYWSVGWKPGEWRGSPPLSTLRMYPIVIWFTGYDWASPLTQQDEQDLAYALDRGTNLFLITQDYLFARDLTPFAQNYLGVDSYTDELTTTHVIGVRDNSTTRLVPRYSLSYPYPNRSDALTPSQTNDTALEGSHDQSVALTHAGTSFRTSFFAFPFEAIDSSEGRRLVMRQISGWLSWLGGSTFTASDRRSPSGAAVTYTLTLTNDGWQPIQALASNCLPPLLNLEPGSLSPPEAYYDPGSACITWDRSLSVGEQAHMSYRATVVDPLPPTPITNVVEIGYDEHHVRFDLAHILDVNAPDLSASHLAVDKPAVQPGEMLTYTVSLRNEGLSPAASVVLTNPMPSYTTYLSGSLIHEGGGTATDEHGIIRWTGALDVGEIVTLTYQVELTTPQRGKMIRNVAYLVDSYAPMRRLEAQTMISPLSIWLPVIVNGEEG